ncbi:MAG: response regulator [Alphaproteobacteria bacterium]
MNSVLIIDNSSVICDLLDKIFSKMFFETFTAESGEEGLKLFEKYLPNVVILDYNLPIIEGVDVLYKIRGMKDIKQPKIIFCTSLNYMNNIKTALDAGCDDYIIRPFDEEIISSKLKLLEVI